jgi:hypothetical protein
VGGANYSDIYKNEMNSFTQPCNNKTNNNQLKVPTLPEIERKVAKLENRQLDEKQYIAYEIIGLHISSRIGERWEQSQNNLVFISTTKHGMS